jgi:hypothetical protein
LPLLRVDMTDTLKTLILTLSSEPWRRSLAGVLGGLVGWALVEPFFCEGGCTGRWGMGNAFFFPVVVGTISGALLLADVLRREQFPSAAALALAGFGVAFGLGFLFQMPLHLLFVWLKPLAEVSLDSPGLGHFWPALTARCLAWGGFGVVPAVVPGIVTGNWRVYGAAVMGGVLGGLMGGFIFDPLHMWLHATPGGPAWVSRVTGFAIMGGMAGFLAGVFEGITVQGRLVVLSGSLVGTQLVLDEGPCSIGTAGQCTVVLPEEGSVQPIHAVIQKVGFAFEIEQEHSSADTLVNEQPVTRAWLRDGDRIRIGQTKLAFFCG